MIKDLIVTGDKIQDEYRLGTMVGTKFETLKTIRAMGGAGNTFANAAAISHPSVNIIDGTLLGDLPTLTRYIADSKQVLSVWNTPQHLRDCSLPSTPLNNYHHGRQWYVTERPTGLVLSDYNKGVLNFTPMWPHSIHSISDLRFIVVDSKYRSLHPHWLSTNAIKIWRCTGDEYDSEWAKQFDWIVWTNADAPVKIFTSEYMWKKEQGSEDKWVTSIEVPEIEVVDVCGAGDTFTAALAVYLCTVPQIDRHTITNGAKFAIKCAQDVCGKQFTAVTDIHM